MDETVREIIPQRPYRHFKGNLYYVYDVCMNTETEEMMVYYQAMYAPYRKFVRPLDMFMGLVDQKKYPDAKQKYRFELYDEEKR